MSNFTSPETGDFDKYFMTTTELIDRFAQGGLWLWGGDGYGQLGDNAITSKSSPVQTVAGATSWKQITCGSNITAAIKTNGTLWLWGSDTYGELGDNATSSKSSPIQTVAGGTNWKQVSGANNFSTAIKTDGTLWCWGKNNIGQLGASTLAHKSSPVQTICGGTNWKQVACGSNHTAAIKTDGTLWTWGSNTYGELGDSTRTNRSSPTQTISGGTDWNQVSIGNHTMAIKSDGTLWGWGLNSYGQLGDSTTITIRSSPTQTISGGTNWKQVACGSNHTAAIKTDGTLWTWGYNNSGQLGDNTTTSKSSPTQTISGGTNWKQVACGGTHIISIKSDGTLWGWGLNSYGQLGDNTRTNRSSPTQTISDGTNWKQVACGSNYTSAVQYSDIGQVL